MARLGRGIHDREPAAGEDRVGQAVESLAGDSSRRGFLARVGGALVAATAGGLVAKAVKPGDAEAYHFCGHIFTTGSCVHPLGLPRLDSRGRPIHPTDGKPVDDLGRRINGHGLPIHEGGDLIRDPDGRPLPPGPRTNVCSRTAHIYGINAALQGGWYRCCGGKVRKLWDCCSPSDRRINGDASLSGYCYGGRKVFCVTYFQTNVPC
jgi:hypothetical protein